MRHRPWIPIVAVLLALLFYFGNRWYRSPEVQTKIRTTVEQTIADLISGDVSITEMKVGLLAVTVSGLDLDIPLNSMEIHVDQLQIGFSLMALLKRNWEPQELVDRITVVRPHITITPGEMKSQDNSSPPLPIEKLVPFRQASMKECLISIQNHGGEKLITVRGLDGEIARVGKNAEIVLNGAVGSLLDNFSLSATMSNSVEEQQLSVRLKGVELHEIISDSTLDISGTVDGSLETLFQGGSFPRSVLPDGWLKISKVSVADSAQQFLTDGTVELLLEEGAVSSREISGEIPGGEFTGELEFRLNDTLSGKFTSAILLDNKNRPIAPLADLTGTINVELMIPSLLGEFFPLSLDAKLKQGENSFDISAFGALRDSGVQFETVEVATPFGTIESSVSYLENRLVCSGESQVLYRLTPAITLAGIVPFKIEYEADAGEPQIEMSAKKLRLISDNGELPFPLLKLQTIRESVMIQGKSLDLSFVAHIANFLNPAEQFHAELSISNEGFHKLTRFAGQAEFVKDGTITVEVDGKEGVTDIRSGVTLAGEFGKLQLFGSGEWGGEQNRFSIENGHYSWNKLELPFTAQLKELKKGWQFEIISSDNTLKTAGVISKKFDHLHDVTATLSGISIAWLNTLLPEDDIIIRDGTLDGEFTISGPLNDPEAKGDLKISAFSVGALDSVNSEISLRWKNGRGVISPFSCDRNGKKIIESETILLGDTLSFNISLDQVDIGRALKFLPGEPFSGTVSGVVKSDSSDIALQLSSPFLSHGDISLDSVNMQARIRNQFLEIDSLSFIHHDVHGRGTLRYPLTDNRKDTLRFDLFLEGDLLKSAAQFKDSPIGGSGEGTVALKGAISSGELELDQARFIIPSGEMTLYPYVRGTVKSLYVDVQAERNDSVMLSVRGEIGRKNLVIRNSYDYNKALKPIKLGPVDLGVIQIFTDEGGVPLFIPGFLENRKGNVGWIEVAGKDSIKEFTLSGTPPDDFLITGTLKLRKAEITFPLLEDVEWPSDFDPFPFIGFDLDVEAADRSVTYFYRVGDMKKRRSIKMVECILDPSMSIGVRGRDQDGDFRIVGGIRSYKGFLFYGKMFDQNFEMGLDFSSGKTKDELYDNLPIIWGSAETYADTNRFDRSQVVIMTKDPKDGTLHRRGRFTELVIVPAEGVNEDGVQDEQSADFYRNTGKNMANLEGAGNTLTGIGDRYVNSYVFNYWGRQMARHMGLDMIRLETSMMSNAFNSLYEHQLDSSMAINWSHLALANTGITLGKYVAGDQLLLKMRTQLTPLDTLLIPEYKLGFEYQPLRYLWMDLNYGIKHDYTTNRVEMNPEVRLQLRMPFSKIQDAFDRK